MPHEQSFLSSVLSVWEDQLTVMRLFFSLVHPLLRASGKDKTMKRIPKTPVEFDYDLWTTEDGKCMVRVKITGEVTEVDREVMKILRVEEKRVRRSYGTDDVYADEPSDSTPTLLSLDAIPSEEREASAWLMDPSDFTKETAFNAGVSDFLKYLTANQQRVFIECFLKGQSYKEYAEENGIRAQSVQETAKYVKRKAKKFFKKF